MTRPFLETAVRRRVLRLPNVRTRQDSAVEGLASDTANSRVTGIRIGRGTLVGIW